VSRHANGEGSIYRRKDGRYEAAVFVLTTSGTRKRIRKIGKTRQEAYEKLAEVKTQAQRGIPLPDRNWKLGEYLDYWLENVVLPNRRPATYEQYEWIIRTYLKPDLGTEQLTLLSVPKVQTFLNRKIEEQHSIRKAHVMRMVLSAALGQAQRDELISRNVARHVVLPRYKPKEIRPWSGEEAKQFLAAASTDPLQSAFVLLVLYGLRRGELLGLRWQDLDFIESEIRVRQQLQRVGHALVQGPVKTDAGNRDLPLLDLASEALSAQQLRQRMMRESAGADWRDTGLVFTTKTGRPIEPKNLLRSFHRVCLQHGIRAIRIHDVRHTAATLLKDLGVQARDAQLILGHAHVSTTQQLYQHANMTTRREALGKVERLFWRAAGSSRCRQLLPSAQQFVDEITSFLSGTPGRIRTCDPLVRSSIHKGMQSRATAVNRLVDERRKTWLVGLVAVSAAVKV
jgi:integrase